MDDKPRRRSGSAVLPILLIAVGVLALVGNLGWIGWGSLLALLNLWPIVLLAVGVDMLTRGRYRTFVVVGAIVVAALFYAADPGSGRVFGSGKTATHVVEHALDGAERGDVKIDSGVGALNIDALAGGGSFVRGTIETTGGVRVTDRFTRSGNSARLELGTRSRGLFSFGAVRGGPWNLSFNSSVPISLHVDAGVGHSTLQLRDLRLSSFDLDAGVGTVDLTLPASGSYRAGIDAGVGKVNVRVPRGMAASIRLDRGIGTVRVAPEFTEDGKDRYVSAGYATAANRVEIAIDGGVGGVTIEQLP